ncbi:unnamed protein product [Phytomonas sp. EM1]|nr:unnamed protein product [Phytomonas sp. EM1]|eukprot:CCW60319.1 unnamed protein product [Phytomonas sp. isolate EM1]
MEAYETLGILGEGTYGVVLKAVHRTTGKLVAIKKFKQTDADDYVHKTSLREVRILKQLHHPNVISLFDVFRRNDKLYLVFELVENTILQLLERTRTGMDPQDVRRYAYQILRGIDYCHAHNVIHRDVKPENILVSRDGFLKICDFGFARHLTVGGKYTDYVATRWYRAPELLVGDVYYDRSVDVWAIGCIIAELTNSLPLFPGESDLDQLYLILKTCGPLPERMVRTFERNPLFRAVSFPHTEVQLTLQQRFPNQPPELLEFLSACLSLDPEDRPSCADLMNFSYFQKNNFQAEYEAELQRTAASLCRRASTEFIMAPLSSKAPTIPNSTRNPLNPFDVNYDKSMNNGHERKPNTQEQKVSSREPADSFFLPLPLAHKYTTEQSEASEGGRLPSIIDNLPCTSYHSSQREGQGVVKGDTLEAGGELVIHDKSREKSPPPLPNDPKPVQSSTNTDNSHRGSIAARIPSLDVLWSKYLSSSMQMSGGPDSASKMPPIFSNVTNLSTTTTGGVAGSVQPNMAQRQFVTAVVGDEDGPLQLAPSPRSKQQRLGETNSIRTSSPKAPPAHDAGGKHQIDRKKISTKPYRMPLSEVQLGSSTCNSNVNATIVSLPNMGFAKGEGLSGSQTFCHAPKPNQASTKHFSNNSGDILNTNPSPAYLAPLTGRDDINNVDPLSSKEFDPKVAKRATNALKVLSSIGDNTLYTLNGTTMDSKASRGNKSTSKLHLEQQQHMQRLPMGGIYLWREGLSQAHDPSTTIKGITPGKTVPRKAKSKNTLQTPRNEGVPHLWPQSEPFLPSSPKFNCESKIPENIMSECSPYRGTSILNLHKTLLNSTRNIGNYAPTSHDQHPNSSLNNTLTATVTASMMNTTTKVDTKPISTRYKAPHQDSLRHQRSKDTGDVSIYRKMAEVGHSHKLSPVRQRGVNATGTFHHYNSKESSRRGVSRQTFPHLACEPS